MKKVIIIFFIVLAICLGLKFFIFKDYSFKKVGNNNITAGSKIFEMKSFEAEVEVTVNSNKNTNTYTIKQKYLAPNLSSQEVISPSNISGIKIIYDGSSVKVENSRLNLSKIYENYKYVGENALMLNSFTDEYLASADSKSEENEKEIIYKTVVSGENKHMMYKTLYVDRKTNLPVKMEIQDINQNTIVYILYNVIKINGLNGNDILL